MSISVLERAAAAVGAEPAVLARIREAAIGLALWQRSRPTSLAWIDALRLDGLDDVAFATAIDGLDVEVAGRLEQAGYPRGGRGDALRAEIVALALRFAAIMDRDGVKMRLEVVDTDACRKFHADIVTARLLTTLRGRGTDWIETASPEQVHRLAAGDVAIFKGRLWAEPPPILHRSPPLAGTGGRDAPAAGHPAVGRAVAGRRCRRLSARAADKLFRSNRRYMWH